MTETNDSPTTEDQPEVMNLLALAVKGALYSGQALEQAADLLEADQEPAFVVPIALLRGWSEDLGRAGHSVDLLRVNIKGGWKIKALRTELETLKDGLEALKAKWAESRSP